MGLLLGSPSLKVHGGTTDATLDLCCDAASEFKRYWLRHSHLLCHPERRAEQLIYTSENLRLMLQEWERIWFTDQPDHMTPYRVHGGVI